MATDKKSFILYCDQKGLWDKLNNEQAGKLIKHILAYVNDENPTTDDFITELAFEPIKQQLKRDLKDWEEKRTGRSIAGKAGAEARWQKMATDGNRINDMAKMAVNDSVNVNVNVNDNGNVIEIKTLAWFEKQIDEIYREKLKMTYIGKDVNQAIKEAYNYISSDTLRMHNLDGAGAKKLVNTWLANTRNGQKQKERTKLL